MIGALLVVVGLFVHTQTEWFPGNARDVLGDALWATMLACWISALSPHLPATVRYLTALLACFGVELSQLWHAAALDYARSFSFGRLVLGSGFDPRDFLAYALGVLIFVAIDRFLMRRPRQSA